MTTFDEARAIVEAALAPNYPPEAEFVVAPWGLENATDYQLFAGPYPCVYDVRDEDDLQWLKPADGPQLIVNKATGELTVRVDGGPWVIPDAVNCGEPDPYEEEE